jgi:predicted acylesterase/phospholipase RssA
VCAVTGFESTAVIRSYETDNYDRLLDVCKIWEAARATSAASTLFEPISIGRPPTRFVDGALKHNNPINLADIEASSKEI